MAFRRRRDSSSSDCNSPDSFKTSEQTDFPKQTEENDDGQPGKSVAENFADLQKLYGDFGTIRKKKRSCIIYSDDKHKVKWDIFIIFLLIIVCTIIPWRLAFAEEDQTPTAKQVWEYVYYGIDFLFFLDMIFTFFTTIPSTEGMTEIYDHKVIAKIYLKSWFAIDLLSIIPFDALLKALRGGAGGANFNVVLRVSRFSKIYKLIRLMRLIKILKVLKNKNNLTD